MTSESEGERHDAIVIGGGFYGCCLALFLSQCLHSVVIVEKESDLMTRASYANQARVHMGYHYPRSFMTAVRSFINFPRFCMDFRSCIDDSFQMIYAIACRNSKVNAWQFKRRYDDIGAPIRPAPKHIRTLFNTQFIEEIFLVKEFAFDAVKLREIMKQRLEAAQVGVLCNTYVEKVARSKDGRLTVSLDDGSNLMGGQVFNCTYSQINTVLHNSGLPLLPLKHEITEIALIEVPEALKDFGVTIMDGPFFSTMPFPPRGVHSLSHVRYTPHEHWYDQETYRDAHEYLERRNPESNCVPMLKDAQRYLPLLREAKYIDSLFEVKTVLAQNEIDDGRPILLRKDYGLENFFVITGGKIDNVYDALQALTGLKEFSRDIGNGSHKWWSL